MEQTHHYRAGDMVLWWPDYGDDLTQGKQYLVLEVTWNDRLGEQVLAIRDDVGDRRQMVSGLFRPSHSFMAAAEEYEEIMQIQEMLDGTGKTQV